jgi:hypothetical protein
MPKCYRKRHTITVRVCNFLFIAVFSCGSLGVQDKVALLCSSSLDCCSAHCLLVLFTTEHGFACGVVAAPFARLRRRHGAWFALPVTDEAVLVADPYQ